MTHHLVTQLGQSWEPAGWRDLTVLVAVSGGADSVALLRGLLALAPPATGQIVAAHFNHRLRGSESDADEAFVHDLCRQAAIPCEAGRSAGPVAAPAAPAGVEAAARKARYRFLRAAARKRGARFIATAHTADDQAETILHRILRGSGIGGLAGIPRRRELTPGITLVRPLLTANRRDVLDFLNSLGQPFREDASNRELHFTRNRLRHELLPLLARDYNPQVADALIRLGKIASQTQQLVNQLARDLAEECLLERAADRVSLDCRKVENAHPMVVREMLVSIWQDRNWPQQEMGYEKWEQLGRLARSPDSAGPLTLPGEVTARRQLNTLVLARPQR